MFNRSGVYNDITHSWAGAWLIFKTSERTKESSSHRRNQKDNSKPSLVSLIRGEAWVWWGYSHALPQIKPSSHSMQTTGLSWSAMPGSFHGAQLWKIRLTDPKSLKTHVHTQKTLFVYINFSCNLICIKCWAWIEYDSISSLKGSFPGLHLVPCTHTELQCSLT